MKKRKSILIIMDGWGHGPQAEVSAIAQAKTPFIDSLYQQYSCAELQTHGEEVGLPNGQMGNSEVGHLNIGAGRVVYQELLRINKAVADESLLQNAVLRSSFEYCIRNKKPLHLMGLVSDGGVHAHHRHLIALCQYAHDAGVPQTYIHAFTDGRDTDPKSGLRYLSELNEAISDLKCELTSVIGRYYAMDRDLRWERIKLAYDLLTQGEGKRIDNLLEGVQQSYDSGITDEFIQPLKLKSADENRGLIKDDDAVLCFNFRTDRCRQITTALHQQDLPEHGMRKIKLHFTTMTRYDDSFKGIHVIFEKDNLKNTIGEVISDAGLSQLRIAETEKYPHVTFFLSGGREVPFTGEKRLMVNSPKVATYDLQPEMSAFEVRDEIVEEMQTNSPDFICLNFANADMVGHTGVFSAAVKAVETVDTCCKSVIEVALKNDYVVFLTADHGNADFMRNDDGSPNTAHTLNPVPLFVFDRGQDYRPKSGKLADIAPSILHTMGVTTPAEMDGKLLI